ncbi:MAG: hypothetical protein M0R21_13280 [Lentimicrobiaceae bacterium]|nr:hypothetical protein [Lentimicrobiaceae bacterium]
MASKKRHANQHRNGQNSINRFFDRFIRRIYGLHTPKHPHVRTQFVKEENEELPDILDDVFNQSSFSQSEKPVRIKRKIRIKKRKKHFSFERLFKRKRNKPIPVLFSQQQEENISWKEKYLFKRNIIFSANSIFIFFIAYLVCWFIYQFAVVIAASLFRIDAVLYYFEVLFPIGNSSTLWTPLNIIAITLAGPLASLIAGIIYHRFLLMNKKVYGNTKLLGYWLTVHSYSMFFGAFVAGIVTNQGFGYVADWMFLNTFFRILLSLILLFSLTLIGYYLSRFFFEVPMIQLKSKQRFIFYLSQGIIPILICIPLLYFIKIPFKMPQHENILDYDMMALCSVLFAVTPVFFNKEVKPRILSGKEGKRKVKVSIKYLLIMLAALCIYRLGLYYGLYFDIRLHFSVSLY